MFCYKCGKELYDESKFCAYCGAKMPIFLTEEKVEAKEPLSCFEEKGVSDSENIRLTEKTEEKADMNTVAVQHENGDASVTDFSIKYVKEIVNYFIGLVLYIIGVIGCFNNYKKMTSLEGILSSLFEGGDNYGLLLFASFICAVIGIFLMLGNMVEAKLVFGGATVVAVLACIFFGGFFIWVISSLGAFA